MVKFLAADRKRATTFDRDAMANMEISWIWIEEPEWVGKFERIGGNHNRCSRVETTLVVNAFEIGEAQMQPFDGRIGCKQIQRHWIIRVLSYVIDFSPPFSLFSLYIEYIAYHFTLVDLTTRSFGFLDEIIVRIIPREG